jgi:phosphate-selective porin OprO/OprP
MRTIRSFYRALILATFVAICQPIEANDADPSQPDPGPAAVIDSQSWFGYRNGFYARNADGSYRLKIDGDVQVDGRFWTDYRGAGNPDTVFLRRARPIVEATLDRNYFFRVMLDFGQSTPRWQDAYFEMRHLKVATFRFGLMKGPVGLERLQVDTNTMFTERGFPTDLVPNRELGSEVIGEMGEGLITYRAGFFSGVPDGQSVQNSMNGLTFGGRLFSQPFRLVTMPVLRNFGIGLAGTMGDESGLLASFKTPAQTKFFSYSKGVIAAGTHYRISPQAYYYHGPFGALTEYVLSNQEVRATTGSAAELSNSAWQVATSFVVTGDRATYNGITPKHPLVGERRGTGAVELVARYGRLNIDRAAFPLYANPASAAQSSGAWGVGVNWYPVRLVRLSTDFERASYQYLGTVVKLRTENTVSSRLQLQF